MVVSVNVMMSNRIVLFSNGIRQTSCKRMLGDVISYNFIEPLGYSNPGSITTSVPLPTKLLSMSEIGSNIEDVHEYYKYSTVTCMLIPWLCNSHLSALLLAA